MALDPDQYQRGAILESGGDRFEVRGTVQMEGGGRLLVMGKLGEPQSGLVAEDVVRDNDDDRYSPVEGEDADNARREAFEGAQAGPSTEPAPSTAASDTGGTEGTATGDIPQEAPTTPSSQPTQEQP